MGRKNCTLSCFPASARIMTRSNNRVARSFGDICEMSGGRTPPLAPVAKGAAGASDWSLRAAALVAAMASTEYGKHMGELKRGEQRWDVYLEGQPDTSLGAVRGRIHFVNGQLHKVTGWIFLEWQEKDIQERFGEFSAVELIHFVEAL